MQAVRIEPAQVRPFELGRGETAWPTVVLQLACFALQAASARLFPVPIAVLVCAVCAYAQFTVAHDAAHRSVSRRPWLNEACGTAAALVLFGPFEAFRRN